MLIETEPCKDCDFSPIFCSCDIDICQITRGESEPMSEEQYEAEKSERYTKYEYDSIRNHEYGQDDKQTPKSTDTAQKRIGEYVYTIQM